MYVTVIEEDGSRAFTVNDTETEALALAEQWGDAAEVFPVRVCEGTDPQTWDYDNERGVYLALDADTASSASRQYFIDTGCYLRFDGYSDGYSDEDSFAEAWAKHAAAHPEVLASWRKQNGRWPVGHPNADETGRAW